MFLAGTALWGQGLLDQAVYERCVRLVADFGFEVLAVSCWRLGWAEDRFVLTALSLSVDE